MCTASGSRRSIHFDAGPDHRISQGFSRVVTAETVTATGYRKSRVAPVERPSAAMMKENSPICARLIPARIDVRIPWPARNDQNVTPIMFPARTRARKTTMGIQCRTMSAGSISIPTETKNTAAKPSHIGFTVRATFFSNPDSATRAPAMKAPSATEYPKTRARRAQPKQMPTLATSVVSGRFRRTTARIRRGTVSIPTTSSPARNKARRPPVMASSRADRAVPEETVVRIVKRRIAIRSSTIRMPKTISVNFPLIPCSMNTAPMITVLEMERAAPA